MDSPCIKQIVCKVLKIFQYGKYLVAYVLKKQPFVTDFFFMGIIHQRHEHWLHLLIARVLFDRLSLSNDHGILELFFVTYQQEKIVKSSQLLQNIVLNTHIVVRLGYYYHRSVKCLDASNYKEFFWKMKQVSAKRITKEDIVYFGDFFAYWKAPSPTDSRSFEIVVRMIKSQQVDSRRIFKRQAMALIRLRVCAGWSEPLLVAHTTLLETCIVMHAGKFHMPFKQNACFQKQSFRIPSECQIVWI